MRLGEVKYLKEYALEYVSFGKRLGFFDYNMGVEIQNRILNLDVTFNNSLPGDAFLEDNNKMVINGNRLQDEKYFSLVLFHEFTHLCNDFHNDIHTKGDNSLIVKLRNNASSYINTNYTNGSNTTKMGDVNNPFTYMAFAGLLLDEVIAENVATEMVKMKYNECVPLEKIQRNYGRNTISYRTHFKYYGIGEELVNEFSKTLFLKNNCKNLNGLCKEGFKKDFVCNLIHQHYENREAFEALIEELAFFGVIAFEEEQRNGRYKDRERISDTLIVDSFNKVKKIIEEGREGREVMPSNIPLPSFME